MSDNVGISVGTGAKAATDEAVFSDETTHVPLFRRVYVTGVEGAKVVREILDRATRSDSYAGAANGTALDLQYQGMQQVAVQVKGTGAAPTAWVVVVDGSLDNTNWTEIGSHESALGDADGQVRWFDVGPFLYLRSRCLSVTLGGASDIVVTLVALPFGGAAQTTVRTYHRVLTGDTNAVNIKARPGRVLAVRLYNNAGTSRYAKMHNTAGTPTAGAFAVHICTPAPAGLRGETRLESGGRYFNAGIAVTVVTGITDADAGACTLNDGLLEVQYV